jgi:hypothetical protein
VLTSRGNRLFASCLGAVLVYCAQSIFCFAEHAGLISCLTEVEQHQTTGSEKQSNAHACQEHSHSAIAVKFAGVPTAGLFGEICVERDATAPDGPTRDIDYPPQLS